MHSYKDYLLEVFRTRNVEKDVLLIVTKTIGDAFSFNIDIRDQYLDIPIEIFDDVRNQYLAEGILYIVYRHKKKDSFALVLADVDAYVPGLNFVFGLAIPSIRVAGVFLPRLRFNATTEVFIERLKKESLHELGHILGLDHCPYPHCVMNFSNSVFDVDGKNAKFCKKCSMKLLRNGFNINNEFVL